ncbi:MAG: hypothetical protein QOH88_2547 [Verrucomicrobiota bacterium]|jgi:subtilisin family serine protease
MEASMDALALGQDRVEVMVEMEGAPAAATYAVELQMAQVDAAKSTRIPMAAAQNGTNRNVQLDSMATARVQSRVLTVDAAQQALMPALSNMNANVLFRTQRVYNGIAIEIDPRKISEIASMPGVKAVHAMVPKEPSAFSDIDFLGTRTFWNKVYAQGVGVHGENIKVAVIDSGLDYVHTNFGGDGNYAGVTDTNSNGKFPNAKVPGGFDLAGDNYAAGVAGHNTPVPDPNPFDGNPGGSGIPNVGVSAGHGTGCASLVAGFGVNFGGTRYLGNYDSATPIASLKISPGQAPLALLYPYRVFGSQGSTNLVTAAIEKAIDPNGDGDFSDKADVISMSLGSNNGTADDDTAVSAANAALAGVIVCSASGNAGDSYYITSSPAVANRTLSVAASYNDQTGFISDAAVLGVNAAGQPAGSIAGQKGFAIYANTSPHTKVTGNLVYAVPADSGPTAPNGTTPLANAAQVSGNIVLIDRGTSTFSEKAQRAMAAGAIGIIIANNQRTDVPNNDPVGQDTSTSTPPLNIPDVMISKEDGDYIKSQANFNPATGVPVNQTVVTIQPDNTAVSRPNAPADTMPGYNARGPKIGNSFLKPDITSPAEVVGIADNRSSNGVALFNGTSSSTPHIAGSMALMKQLHPTWTVEELMALAMNTALHNVETTVQRTTVYGDSRVGAGRQDNNLAANASCVAFNGTDPGLVSISFGDVQVPVTSAVHLVKNMIVRNKTGAPVSYNLAYAENGPAVGDSYYGTTSPTSFTVPANGQVVIPIQFNATGSTLNHAREAAVPNGQTTFAGTLARTWLTEKAGYAVLTPTAGPAGEPTLRVPLHTVVKPVSSMHATITSFDPQTVNGQFTIDFAGAGIVSPGANANAGRILSLLKPLELSYVNPLAGQPNAPSNQEAIKYVGITSDFSTGGGNATTLTFAIDHFADAACPDTVCGSNTRIYLDTDKNGTDDYVAYVQGLAQSATSTVNTNVYYSGVFSLYTNNGFIEYPVNGFTPQQFDTNTFNNSIVVVSFDAKDVGYTGGASSFNYRIESKDGNGNVVTNTGPLTYDLAKPGIDGNTGFEPTGNWYQDAQGQSLNIKYNSANMQANKALGVMLVHLHNPKGDRTDIVTFVRPTITGFTPSHGAVGTNVVISGFNFGPTTRVFFGGNKEATPVTVLSANTIEAKVPAGAVTGPITVTGPGGSTTSSATFTVDAANPSPSPSPSTTPSPTGLRQIDR